MWDVQLISERAFGAEQEEHGTHANMTANIEKIHQPPETYSVPLSVFRSFRVLDNLGASVTVCRFEHR